MKSKSILIFNYTDYREYLRDSYTFRKKNDSKFSHRYIALRVGATSSGWFSDIINGRINLTRAFLPKLCRLLGLKQREGDFFELLVNYNQAESLDMKNRYFHKMLTYKEVNPSLVNREQFEFYSNWYITAIRELLLTYEFSDNYQSLAKKLDPPIKAFEAKEAVKILISCGLVEKNAQGFYKPINKTITKDSAFRSIHWANFVTSMMKLAMESVDRHEKSQRDISSVTVGLSEQSLDVAREEIAELRKKLLALSEHDGCPQAVYQCNVQLFPLTQILKRQA